MRPSIFFEFNLPNSPTWFYFALFLAVALLFQFTRLLSVRNADLLALFLFVPGFLLIQEANLAVGEPAETTARERFLGYIWLLAASGFWFARCLVDLALPRRPLPTPNLTTPGMMWFGTSLFVCLAVMNFTRPTDPWEPVGSQPVAIAGVEQGAAAVVRHTQPNEPTADVQFWVKRSLAVASHLAVVVGLLMVGVRQFQDWATGAAAATLYLLLPYTAYHFGQLHHVWPAAMILWAVFAYRHPWVSGGLLGLAAGTSFFPLLLAPVWTHFYRDRGAGRFVAAFVVAGATSLGATIGLVALAGPVPDAVWPALQFADWQPWRVPTAESVWTGAHWAYRLPVFILYAAFVLATAAWPSVRNLGELIAVSAAVLIGVQFWFADRGGLYVLWYTPLLVLLTMRPTATDLIPPVLSRWPSFLSRTARVPLVPQAVGTP